MPVTGWLSLLDGLAALALLLSVPRQGRNRAAVLGVAAVLIGISGWLAVLALDKPHQPAPDQLTPSGRVA